MHYFNNKKKKLLKTFNIFFLLDFFLEFLPRLKMFMLFTESLLTVRPCSPEYFLCLERMEDTEAEQSILFAHSVIHCAVGPHTSSSDWRVYSMRNCIDTEGKYMQFLHPYKETKCKNLQTL